MRTTTVAVAILLITGIGHAVVGAHGAQAAASTKASPAGVDACALLTTQEASAAVGQGVEPKPKNVPEGAMPGVNVATCEYVSASRDSVQVIVWRPFGDSAQMFLQIYKSECLKKEQVSGLGDTACWNSKEHRELQVLKGTTILTVELKRSGSFPEALMTATKKAVARLP